MQIAIKPFLFSIFVLLAAPAAVSDVMDKTLKIGRQELNSEATDMGIAVLNAAYKKIGVKVQYVPYPPRRAAMLMQNRSLDGEVMRIREYEESSKSLIRIKTPVNFLRVVVISRPPCPQIRNWSDFKTLKTGYQRGILLFEENLLPTQRKEYRGYPDIFNGILQNEVDLGVGFLMETTRALRQLPKKSVCQLELGIEPVPVFHFLDQRHHELAEKLESTLKQMQKRGEIQRILEQKRAEILSL